jgi:hypothetical protein
MAVERRSRVPLVDRVAEAHLVGVQRLDRRHAQSGDDRREDRTVLGPHRRAGGRLVVGLVLGRPVIRDAHDDVVLVERIGAVEVVRVRGEQVHRGEVRADVVGPTGVLERVVDAVAVDGRRHEHLVDVDRGVVVHGDVQLTRDLTGIQRGQVEVAVQVHWIPARDEASRLQRVRVQAEGMVAADRRVAHIGRRRRSGAQAEHREQRAHEEHEPNLHKTPIEYWTARPPDRPGTPRKVFARRRRAQRPARRLVRPPVGEGPGHDGAGSSTHLRAGRARPRGRLGRRAADGYEDSRRATAPARPLDLRPVAVVRPRTRRRRPRAPGPPRPGCARRGARRSCARGT